MPQAPPDAGAGLGRLDAPPLPSSYVQFPEDFGRRFTIFVDTEEEFDWGKPLSRDQRATTHMKAMPRMQAHMRQAGATPVYLVDHPIATDPASVEMLRAWQDAEECTVGTQLHPWVNPPFEEEVTGRNSFTGNLPLQLQRAKLAVLTETIEQAFGRRPTVYRAGRYGVGEHSAALLQEAGYTVDVSVRALFDYSAEAGPDFAQVAPLPFWAGDGNLLEVPLSAASVGRLRGRGSSLYPATARHPRLRSLLARTGLLNRIALTPEDMPLKDALKAARVLLDEGARVFSISFHSPSVEPGHTPYVRDPKELDLFYAWWDGLFDFFAKNGIEPATIEEIRAAAEASRRAA